MLREPKSIRQHGREMGHVPLLDELAIVAALVAVVVLFAQHWDLVLVSVLLALAAFLLYQRFREFTG